MRFFAAGDDPGDLNLPDVLMTVCTYDERGQADQDASLLRSHGIRAAVEPCLYHDPDNPGAELLDVVVFDQDVARAQEILGLLPPDPIEPVDPIGFAAARRRARWLLIGLSCVAALVVFLNAL